MRDMRFAVAFERDGGTEYATDDEEETRPVKMEAEKQNRKRWYSSRSSPKWVFDPPPEDANLGLLDRSC